MTNLLQHLDLSEGFFAEQLKIAEIGRKNTEGDSFSKSWNKIDLDFSNETKAALSYNIVSNYLQKLNLSYDPIIKTKVGYSFGNNQFLGTCHPASQKNYFQINLSGHIPRITKKDVLDVYCGIFLHELSHAKESNFSLDIPDKDFVYFNLLEDHYVENKVHENAPGYFRYIEVARHHLMEQQLQEDLNNFSQARYNEQLSLLFFTFIRMPVLLNNTDILDFKSKDSENVCTALNHLLSQSDIWKDLTYGAKQIRELFLYFADEEKEQENQKQESNESPNEQSEQSKNTHNDPDLNEKDDQTNEENSSEKSSSKDNAEQTLKAITKALNKGSQLPKENTGELHKAAQVADQYVSIEQDTNSSVVIFEKKNKKPSIEKYNNFKNSVAREVTVLKNILNLRSRTRRVDRLEKLVGTLDTKKLCKGTITNRIFKKTHTKKQKDAHILILLDSSGSLQGCSYRPSSQYNSLGTEVLRMGVTFYEALKDQNKIKLDIYSHTTDYNTSSIAIVNHLENNNHYNLANYGESMIENGDGYAIAYCGKKLLQSNYENKVMIVVSDGLPSIVALGYTGSYAENHTRAEIKKLENKGIKMIGFGIGGCDVSKLYKRHICAEENSQIIHRFGQIITKELLD